MKKQSKELFDKRYRYSIRRLSIGAASVAIGCLLFGTNLEQAYANTQPEADTSVQPNADGAAASLSSEAQTLLAEVNALEELVLALENEEYRELGQGYVTTFIEAIVSGDSARINQVKEELPLIRQLIMQSGATAARETNAAGGEETSEPQAQPPVAEPAAEVATGPSAEVNADQADQAETAAPEAAVVSAEDIQTAIIALDFENAAQDEVEALEALIARAEEAVGANDSTAMASAYADLRRALELRNARRTETPTSLDIPVLDTNNYVLNYRTPAPTTYEGWEKQALPVGNGEIGNKLYGLVGRERIQFNEKTLWSGGPLPNSTTYNGGNNLGKHEYLDDIRQALEAGNLTRAKELAEAHLVGPNSQEYGRYLAFGDVDVDLTNSTKELAEVTDYNRSLDLKTAISTTDYTYNGDSYHRETFVSHPDNVSVTRFSKTGASDMEMDIRMSMTDSLLTRDFTAYQMLKSTYKEATVTYTQEGILMSGRVRNNDLRFAAFIKVDTDGEWTVENDKLRITGASYADLYLSAETDFAQNPKTNYRKVGFDVADFVRTTATAAKNKGFEAVKAAHIADYQSIYNRVKLNLNTTDSNGQTNELLSQYKPSTGQELEELFFQYGRYLMITSSRPGENALPANLQGVWNAVDNPPWNSDYHLNVNLQMNYWPVYSSNMAESAIPLINYIDDLRYYGRIAAKEYANIVSEEGEENGWLVHTQTTPFGWTTPGWSYYWGWSPASNAWIMQNVYDYYKFTQDKDYLQTKIYPMLKETAKFWNQFLHYDQESDRWVSSPSYSPEHGTITIGNTYDQSLVWQLFHDFMEAAKILDVDQELVAEIKLKFDKLSPLHINSEGRIKEWYEEDTEKFTSAHRGQPGHRHVSELVGLFPGTLFSKDTPQYLEAAKATLNHRGDGGTGWSKANKINLWARLLDGNRAHRLLSEQLKNSTLNNLWDTHPPFQIDGNFGATSGMTEMLLQSHSGYIALLPALPDAWAGGQVTGLMARGNVQVDMSWANKNLQRARLVSNVGGTITVDYPNIETARVTINGRAVTARILQDGRVELDTQKGDVIVFETIVPRITDLAVRRTGARTAEVSFSAVDGALAYQIERVKVGATEEGATKYFRSETSQFTDETLLPSYDYIYRVRPIYEHGAKAFSDSVTISRLKDLLDDRDPSIQYGSVFGNWTDEQLWSSTEKYGDITRNRNIAPEAATVTIPFIGTGIEVYGLKHSGLGKAIVMIDGQEVPELDFYKTGTIERSILIGRYANLEDGPHTMTIRINPATPTREGETNKISLDYFKVIRDTSREYEVLDDRDTRIQYGSVYNNWGDSALYARTEKYGTREDNTTDAQATATLTFEGTGIQIYGLKSNNLGRAIVTIDDQPVESLEFNHSAATAAKSVLIGEYTGLENGRHTIKIMIANESVNGGRKKISLDYFRILKPELTETRMGAEMEAEIPWTAPQPSAPDSGPDTGGDAGSTPSTPDTGGDTGSTPSTPDTGGDTGSTPSTPGTGGDTGSTPSTPDTGGDAGSTPSTPDTGGDAGSTPSTPDTGGDTGSTPSTPDTGGDTGSTPSTPDTGSDTGNTPTTPDTGGDTGSTPSTPDTGGDAGNTPSTPDTGGDTGSTPSTPDTGGDTGSTPSTPDTGGDTGSTPTTPDTGGDTGSTPSTPDTGGDAGNTPTTPGDSGSVDTGTPPTDTPADTRTLVNEATGVRLDLQAGENPAIAGASIVHIERPEQAPAILTGQDYDLFDIELLDTNGQIVDNSYPVKVTLPVDPGKSVDRVIYLPNAHTEESLDFQEVQVSQADGSLTKAIVFTAAHFSAYAIVYKPIETPPAPDRESGKEPTLPSLNLSAIQASHPTVTKKDEKASLPNTGVASNVTLTALGFLGLVAAAKLRRQRQ